MAWAQRLAAAAALAVATGCASMRAQPPALGVTAAPAPAWPDCRAAPAIRFSYRKRLVVTRFDAPEIARWRGLEGIDLGYPRALAERLDGERLVVAAVSEAPLAAAAGAVDEHGRSLDRAALVRALARRHRAQLVVTGELIDLSQQRERNRYSARYRRTPVLGRLARDPERAVSIRVDVHDGFNARLIASQDFDGFARDASDLAPLERAMGPRFMRSPLGRVLDAALAQQREFVDSLSSCLPLQTRVAEVVDGERALLAAGAAQGLRPGDRLRAFRPFSHRDGGERRIELRPLGELEIVSAFPEHALAAPQGEAASPLRRGDLVRAW